MTTRRTLTKRLTDPVAEQVRQSHADAIAELQRMPMADMRVITGVVLPGSTEVFVPHKLGRAPNFVWLSPLYVPPGIGVLVGLIYEVRGVTSTGVTIDRSKAIVLLAGAFGTTVTVDVAVF